jgi:GH18 family chitinase
MLRELQIETKRELENKLITPESFSQSVIEFIEQYDYDPIDGLVEYCNKHEIELNKVPDLMAPRLLSMIQEDAENKHLIERTPKIEW